MPDLTAGTLIKAGDYPVPAYASDTTTILNISSTSYIPDSPVVATTFKAPSTGRVLVTVGLQGGDNTGTNRIFLAYQVYLGADATGTLVRGASVEAYGVGSPSKATNYCTWSRSSVLDGLTPDATYYVRTMHRASAGATCDMTYRDVMVEALP